ncbi:MAG: class 1 fructose-bisphosphatase [Chitinophagales bacterium]|nr:class 1 fructose-bisphosphatase [Chitinophagales bacterium]
MQTGITLNGFLTSKTNIELSKVIISLAEGCKQIARLVSNAGLSGVTGTTGTTNVQGETVQKLDDLSNKILMDYLRASETCAGYLSEENEDIVTLNQSGKYTIAVDPLDGSSNIDVAAPIGTIFCINERLSSAGNVTDADFLQQGTAAKAAGYFVYGSSTILVMSTGNGVFGFTLNTDNYEFYLSHSDVTTPASGKIYSINQGNAAKFDDKVAAFLNYCTTVDKETSRPYSLRYIGSMVGDLHRNLLKGGIFIYPANKGETKGKLRLLYECIPMAFVIENAGGTATNGKQRILELQPVELHERTAIFIGSANMVAKAQEFLNN